MKKSLQVMVIPFAIFLLFINCKKSSSTSTATQAPTNLTINTTISTDGSGTVNFISTATNAVSYDYDFGNGDAKTTAAGTIDYTYTQTGTNNYTVTVTAKGSTGLTLKKTVPITITVAPHVLSLVWSDEFNTDGAPDPAKWGYDLGDGCPNNCGWGNSEAEYYTKRPENAIVQNGVLKINVIKESYSGKPYTSARLLSKDKFDFKYGKVEVKAKLPAGKGTWPAIWMLGSDISSAGWPACGEIDIMEHLGNNLNTIYATLHYPGHSGGSANGATKFVDSVTTAFHIYSLDWSPTVINISADGQLIHSVPNSQALPFNHNFFFILNIAMGGNFGGSIDPAFTNGTMEIDYVRLYK